jgi:hypothetical protein
MKKIISISIILIAVLVVLFWLRNSPETEQRGIEIVWKNEISILSYDSLATMKREEMTAKDGKKYSLIPLKTILAEFEIPLSFEKLTVFAQDSGNISFRPVEIGQVFLLEMTPESYRLVLPDEEFRNSWLKYISKITIQ